MATRSTIVVAIPEDKVGKTYKFEKGNNEYDTPEVTIPEGMHYVSVYHHWDGYPEGLGADLIKEDNGYSNFDDAMSKIIAGGDMSSIGTPYHAWRDEDWDGVQPAFSEDMPEVSEEYQYLLSNGTWFVRGAYGDPKEFTPVKSILAEN